MPKSGCLELATFLNYYQRNNYDSTLALNIKSDGLNKKIFEYIQHFNLKNYFVFDMSIPDTFSYLNIGIQTYIRESEFENYPLLLNKSSGVWLDQMVGNSNNQIWLKSKINSGIDSCFVSPELHKREYLSFWDSLRLADVCNTDHKIMICTDHPVQARSFFNEKN
jgi:hypothetical protein